jgi:hypothetical protein
MLLVGSVEASHYLIDNAIVSKALEDNVQIAALDVREHVSQFAHCKSGRM